MAKKASIYKFSFKSLSLDLKKNKFNFNCPQNVFPLFTKKFIKTMFLIVGNLPNRTLLFCSIIIIYISGARVIVRGKYYDFG